MNTLLLVGNYPSDVGYAWWLMESFWVKLADHYHKYINVVLAYPKVKKLPRSIVCAPIQIVEQDFIGKKLKDIILQCRFIQRYKVKAIYFSDQETWHWRYALYRLYGVRLIIIHDHTPGIRTPISWAKYLLKRFIHLLPLLSADGAIGATEFVRKRLIKVNGVPPTRCYTAPNGLPLSEHLTETIDVYKLFQIPPKRKILVMVARAHRYKGIQFVLKCLAYLSPSYREKLHFLFIGDGPDLKIFVENAKNMGIEDHCTFAGRCNNVQSLLGGCYIAIHPSQGEVGYSLSILEYMRAGLPVIVPDNPSVCEATVHEVTGLIYPEGNVQSASEMIKRLIEDECLRNFLGKQAKILVQNYSLETTHQALLDAFKKIDRKKVLCQTKKIS
jgi:glycosyltransferase involved in cell wall biosynthesis